MKLPIKSKAVLYLLAVFVAGTAAGWALGFAQARQRFLAPPRPGRMVQDKLNEYRRELTLTPAQEGQIEPILSATSSNLHQLHVATMDQVTSAIRKADDQIERVLNPEQRDRFKQLCSKHAEWANKRQRKP